MGEPIRVLQVLGGTGLGGAESRVMDLYRHMDRTRVQFDFAVHSAEPGFFDTEIKSLGGNIYRLPRFRIYNWMAYRRAWKELFCAHTEFAAVHGHMTSTASIYLPLAKRAGIARTAAHARSAGTDSGIKGLMTRFLRRKLWKKTDYCFACSVLAGQAVFGQTAWQKGLVQVLPNAIALEKYAYDPAKREQLRRELELTDRLVIGHVGRFNPMKNHGFLLEIFAEIQKSRPDAALLLLGEGSCMEAARQRAKELGIAQNVLFMGARANAEDYYQAMDFFVFPSQYEGLPGTILEAQAAGLPCLKSDTITDEVNLTELVENASLQETAGDWAKKVLARLEQDEGLRHSRIKELAAAGFEVKEQAGKLALFYEKGELTWERRN